MGSSKKGLQRGRTVQRTRVALLSLWPGACGSWSLNGWPLRTEVPIARDTGSRTTRCQSPKPQLQLYNGFRISALLMPGAARGAPRKNTSGRSKRAYHDGRLLVRRRWLLFVWWKRRVPGCVQMPQFETIKFRQASLASNGKCFRLEGFATEFRLGFREQLRS